MPQQPSASLQELAFLRQTVRVNRDFDPRGVAGFGSDHAAILGDVDGAATLAELLATWGRAGATRALLALDDLLRWGAIDVGGNGEVRRPPARDTARGVAFAAATAPVGTPPPAPAPRPAPLATPAPAPAEDPLADEARLFAEPVELDDATKRRIITAARLLRQGQVLGLLGVQPGSDRAELKRAYYALAKEFHPDRFFNKQLGSFARLTSMVFEAASQAIKTLMDQRTVTPSASPGGHQRRRHPRYPYSAPVRLRCDTWPAPLALSMKQLGAGGLFVGTEQPAASGEHALLELTLPNRSLLQLRARVVERVQAKGQRPAGLCLQFAPMSDADRSRFQSLLDVAKALAPAPSDEPASGSAAPGRFARGSGIQKAIAPIIGIDLGTTFVSVSAAVNGRVHVLPFPDGARSLPSVVAFGENGEIVVGQTARERLARDPRHAISSAKRLLGRRADDPEIQGQVTTAGYETKVGPSGELLLQMWDQPVAIPQVCGYLLQAARVAAERAFGQPVGSAVLTVPVSFGLDRVNLLKRAARLAQLEVLDVIDEPSAAALANRARPDFGGIIGVYDFGGGTFDFSVVDTSQGDFRVIATAGDSWLGGDDFDAAVADALANHVWRSTGVDLRTRAVEWQQLLFAAERAKRELSTADEAIVVVPEAQRTAHGTQDLRGRIQRHQVEALWQPLVERSLNTCLQTLALVGLQASDLSAIYLSGGTTHIPAVRRAVSRVFGRAARNGVPADYAVCLGAGVHAAQLEQLQEPTLPSR